MRYFIVAGEASGDLHASNLMKYLKQIDEGAEFAFLGGDFMCEQGGLLVKHYRDMAFMGVISVIKNLDKVFENFKICKKALLDFVPDVVILVDYPSFNLKIAKYVKEKLHDVPVLYYISPKLWAWKEYRISDMKKYVDKVYSILPFEVDYFKKFNLDVEYVGNPCVDAIKNRNHKDENFYNFISRNSLIDKPIIALLSGSRKQELKSSLPIMLASASKFTDYQMVIAGAPSMCDSDYKEFISNYDVKIVYGETYELLQQAKLAVVTSGTATLETALMRVPQVVVYKLWGGYLIHRILEKIIHVPFISLVNLIYGKELVKELIIEEFNENNVIAEINNLLDEDQRKKMLKGYDKLISLLGEESVSEKAAKSMSDFLNKKK